MPIHDWTRVEAGIFHHFHQNWIIELARSLNAGLLPPDYYAMAEQHAGGFGPDVLALQGVRDDPTGDDDLGPSSARVGLQVAPPKVRRTIETAGAFYRRKQNNVTVRHVSDDRVIAMVEVVSPGNKSGRVAFRKFIDKATSMLQRRVHLLILDLFPPGVHDPRGIHAAIWEECTGDEVEPEAGRPLTLASYESSEPLQAYVEPIAVGDEPAEMPLFLVPGGYVLVPLGPTYRSAFEAFPRRWRGVLEG